MNSKKLFERSLEVAPGGVHSPVRSFQSVEREPIFFESSQGPYLYSVDGGVYIDFCLSFGPLILGHREENVQNEVIKAVDTAWTLGACEPYSLDLAEFIVKEISCIDKIRFVSSGTEAVMSALRIARAHTNRDKVLKFDGCYHGHFDSLLVKAGSGLAGVSSSDSAGVGKSFIENTLVLPLDDEEKLEMLFEKEGETIACVAIEPLPANFGLLKQRKEFISKIFSLAKKFGSLVLFDEVISGFRVGLDGMAGLLDFEPDLICFGKIIGGGFPVGAYAAKSNLMNQVSPSGSVYQAGTLSANPIGMRAGLATLKQCKKENFYTNLNQKTKYFTDNLVKLLNKYSNLDLDAVCEGSIFWLKQKTDIPVRSVDQIPKNHKKDYVNLFGKFLDAGLYFAPSGYEVGFLSSSHTKEVLDKALNQLEDSLKST